MLYFIAACNHSTKQLMTILKVNVMGPIVLFQVVHSLLKKSSNPRFVSIGSRGGCISGGFIEAPIGSVCYGTSKIALHWATRKIHFENNWLGAYDLEKLLCCKIVTPFYHQWHFPCLRVQYAQTWVSRPLNLLS